MTITIGDEVFYKIKEIAEKFKVHPQTVHRWIDDKKLKVKIVSSRKFYINEKDLLKFINGENYDTSTNK